MSPAERCARQRALKTQGTNVVRGESERFLHPTVGRKLDIECRREARWESMNEDEQISNTYTHVEVWQSRYYWKWWALRRGGAEARYRGRFSERVHLRRPPQRSHLSWVSHTVQNCGPRAAMIKGGHLIPVRLLWEKHQDNCIQCESRNEKLGGYL